MRPEEYPFVIGTAGHIDHGKTSLVMALSGVDTDRLSEEKRRGMTIELGFAPLELPSGRTVSIVDVPGHEKFIRQMVAGAAGVDAVMLVIAADDGVMPQTREHLEILSLLNVKNGLTVVNKIDLADDELRGMVFEDTRALLRGTFLEDKPLLGVSSITREGIPELIEAIERMVTNSGARRRSGGFFLPVDRAFHMTGFGTVVTGTTALGVLADGEEVQILPGGSEAKARSIQVHNLAVEKVTAGQRTAINLSGASLEDVKRGSVVAAKGYYSATECLDVRLEITPSYNGFARHWQRVRLHAGTSEVLARLSFLDREKLAPGESTVAQILPEMSVCTYSGASFIIRSYSPVRTIGGGEVLLALGTRPGGKNARAALLRLLASLCAADGDLRKRLPALLEYKGMIRETDLLKLAETDKRELSGAAASLEAKGKIITTGQSERYFFSLSRAEEIKNKTIQLLSRYHAEHPEQKGMEPDEIARSLRFSAARVIKELIYGFAARKWVSLEGEKVRLNEFIPFDEDEFLRLLEATRDFARKKGWALPTIAETQLYLSVGEKEMSRALTRLKDNQEAVIIGGGLILFSFIEEEFKKILLALPRDNITLAEARDRTGSSRKHILPLLEYCDSKNITRRVGDKRILLKGGKTSLSSIKT